jgi:hypothetical protein
MVPHLERFEKDGSERPAFACLLHNAGKGLIECPWLALASEPERSGTQERPSTVGWVLGRGAAGWPAAGSLNSLARREGAGTTTLRQCMLEV